MGALWRERAAGRGAGPTAEETMLLWRQARAPGDAPCRRRHWPRESSDPSRTPRRPLTGSSGSWKILLAVLLARTRVALRAGGCGETHVSDGGSPQPSPPAADRLWRALTVFSLSARLSLFSGESCSCCWSAMVASGVRTESMVVAVADVETVVPEVAKQDPEH